MPSRPNAASQWALALVLLVPVMLFAQTVPPAISYQGRLANAVGLPLEGTVDLTFRFYGAATGGAPFLTVREDDVPVVHGIYNVQIGAGVITPGSEASLPAVFQNHPEVWLGIAVGTDPEMSPRARIASVPYALSLDKLFLDSFMSRYTTAPDYDGDGFTKTGANPDCNDWNAAIYPGAPEIADGLDNQCPGETGYGEIDEWLFCIDADTDGRGDDCIAGLDCDDLDPNNWDLCATCDDLDTDGFFTGCDDYLTIDGPDCDDGELTAYPGAMEICGDTVDNDCDAFADEGCIPMADIPAGCFNMGDAFSEGWGMELPVHNVCLTAGFKMAVHETTNAEYAACVSAGACTAPGIDSTPTRETYFSNPTYANFPVVYVNWIQASAYCAWAHKRLPTEAEWEYAARGGLAGKRFPWGDTLTGTDANYRGSGDAWDNDTSPAQNYASNGYGLYDMTGNVYEWVNDWYGSSYYTGRPSPDNNPTGPATGTSRVYRGGSWDDLLFSQRVSFRLGIPPENNGPQFGFRCAGN